jgi:hypothetical protein
MFKWMKSLFVTAEDVTVPVTQQLVDISPATVTIEKEVKEVKKIETVVEVAVSEIKVTKASLSKLTKQGLEDFAKETYGVDLDKRKKKDDLVKEVLKLSKKV